MTNTRLLLVVLLLLPVALFSNSIQKPVFIFVHGSWHGNWQWYKIEDKLQTAGYKTLSINLPGHGVDSTKPKNVELADYTLAVTRVIDEIDTPVILVGHSLGGIVISEVAEARPTKICKLVYLSAFMLQDGETLFELASQDLNSKILPNIIIDSVQGRIDIKKEMVGEIFYNKCPRNTKILSKNLITAQPLKPVLTPISLTKKNYGSICAYYIETKKDNSITPYLQKKMYSAYPNTCLFSIRTDHSAFFSKVKRLNQILIAIAEGKNYVEPELESDYKIESKAKLSSQKNIIDIPLN